MYYIHERQWEKQEGEKSMKVKGIKTRTERERTDWNDSNALKGISKNII